MVTSLPVFLLLLGGVMTGIENPVTAVFVFPLMIGFALSTVPLQIGVLAAGLLRLSLRQLRQTPFPVESDELPPEVAGYFQQHDVAATEAGLTPLGDFGYEPGRKKFRRFWMAPGGAYLVEATRVSLGQSFLQAVCVFSATSDGRYFETVDNEADLGTTCADRPRTDRPHRNDARCPFRCAHRAAYPISHGLGGRIGLPAAEVCGR